MASVSKKLKYDRSMTFITIRLCDSFKRTPQNLICPFIRAVESVRVFYRLQQQSLKNILFDAGKAVGLQFINITCCPGGTENSTDGNIFIEYKYPTEVWKEDTFIKYKDSVKLRLQNFNINNIIVDQVMEQSTLSQPLITEIDYKIHELDFKFQNYLCQYQHSKEPIPAYPEDIKTLLMELKERRIQIALLSHNAVGKSFILNLLLLLSAETNSKSGEQGRITIPKEIIGNPTVKRVKEDQLENLPEVIKDFLVEVDDDEQDFKNLVQPICHELHFTDQEELEMNEGSFSSLSGCYTHNARIDIEPYLLPQKDICGNYNATTNCIFYLRYGTTFQAKVKYFDEKELQYQLFELVCLEKGSAEKSSRPDIVNERMQEKAKQSLMTRFKILTKNVPDSQNEEELRNVLRSITFPEEIEVCDQVKEFAGKTELYIGNGKDMAADRLALQKILKGFTVLADSDEEEETSSRNVKYKIAALKSLVVYVPSTLLYGGTEILEMPGTNDSDPLAMNFIQDALDDVEVLLLLSEYGFRLAGQEVRDCLKNSSFIKQWIKDPHNHKLMFLSYPEKNLIYQFGAKDGEKIEKIMQEEDKKKEEEFQKFKDLLQPVHLPSEIKQKIFFSTLLPVLHSSILSLEGDPLDILEKNNAFLKNTGIELLIKEIDQITLQRKKDIISEIEKGLEVCEIIQEDEAHEEPEDDTASTTQTIDLEGEKVFLKKNEDIFNKMKDWIEEAIKDAVDNKLKEILERSSLNAEKKWSEIESTVTDTTAFNPQYGGRHPVFKEKMNTVLFGHLDDEIFPVLKDLTENIQHVVDDYKEKAIALFTEELRNRKKIESAVLAKHIECPLRWFLGKTRTSFNENTLKKNFEGLFKDNMKKYVLEPVFRGGIKNTKCKMVTYIHQVSDELQRSFLKDTISLYKEKWPANLAKYMVRICIPLKYSSKPGSTFCGDLKCSVCPYIESTTTFTGKNKNKVYKISGNLNCTTKNVIYLITCKKCEQQYVGQTTRMVKKRFTVHLSGIRSQKESKNESLLVKHFKSEGHSEHDIALVVIQQVSNARSLMEREKYWIRELDTLIPEGLNATL